jgi:hypothetical protein
MWAYATMQEQVVIPPVKNLSKQKSLTDRQQVCSLLYFFSVNVKKKKQVL